MASHTGVVTAAAAVVRAAAAVVRAAAAVAAPAPAPAAGAAGAAGAALLREQQEQQQAAGQRIQHCCVASNHELLLLVLLLLLLEGQHPLASSCMLKAHQVQRHVYAWHDQPAASQSSSPSSSPYLHTAPELLTRPLLLQQGFGVLGTSYRQHE